MKGQKVRVRFAPSPTGFLHIGGLRTALYNELLARKERGDFILRIEDTDQARAVPGAIENICRSLEAVGVIPTEGVWLDPKGKVVERGDDGPYVQSERKAGHQAYAKKLIAMDKAYYCFCAAKRLEDLRKDQQTAGRPTMYDGRCRSLTLAEAEKRIAAGEEHVIRLKLPKQGKARVWDVIRDEIQFDWALIDDQVILKSDGFPTYHLAATCDDHDMRITHVIRGEEWLPSTPKHVFIYESFGWTPPKFAHLPLLLNSDRSKLSKRQGDVAVEDYLGKGYLPEALINFVALLGWNPTGDREIYAHDELAKLFNLPKVNTSGAVFNIEKLDWLNEQYLRSMPEERYLTLTHPFITDKTDDHRFADRCLLLVRDRVRVPSDVAELTGFFFQTALDFKRVSVPWKRQSAADARARLEALITHVESMKVKDFESVKNLEKNIKGFIDKNGWTNGETLWPLRVALSGEEKSPGPFELLWAYGRDRGLERIQAAIEALK